MKFNVTYISGNDLKLHTRTIFAISKESAVIKAFELEGVNFENRLVSVTECASDEEPMTTEYAMDCVSRQAVLEQAIDYGSKTFLIPVNSVKALQSVTPSRPKGKWIPVSERLPKAFRFVNCTCHSLIDDREDWVIETVYAPQPSDSPYSDWGNTPMLNSGDCEVVAWMYRDIPEPYKAESED